MTLEELRRKGYWFGGNAGGTASSRSKKSAEIWEVYYGRQCLHKNSYVTLDRAIEIAQTDYVMRRMRGS